jgi:endonuclease/exonuclease/phosphatase family metal-dependent hydrolase
MSVLILNKYIMKILGSRSLILVCLFSLFACKPAPESIQVVTFNVRYDNPDDGINRWEARIPVIEAYFAAGMPDIIGMQEVLHRQVVDLERMLKGYSFVGTGRDDGKQDGEYAPIFYRKDRFRLLEHSQFWLSETPDVAGSKGWDADITRIVTWARFMQLSGGREFYFFNTHFDHRGVEARRMSATLMSQKIAEIAGDNPVIVTGDFNIRKNHPVAGDDMYNHLMKSFQDNNSLSNAEYVSVAPVTSGGATSTGFRPDWAVHMPGNAIDYIFVNPAFRVESYRVDRIVEGEVFISDHWPVVAEISLTR